MKYKRLVLIMKVHRTVKFTSIYEEAIDECDDEGALVQNEA